MKTEITFFDCYAIADTAARVLAEQRPSKHPGDDMIKCRSFLRESPVRALRYLWKTGDASQRSTVACRVAVWLKRPVDKVHMRVYNREKARLAQ